MLRNSAQRVLSWDRALVGVGSIILGLAIWWAAPWKATPTVIGGPFQLQSSRKEMLTEQSLFGAPFTVFFGFTHCPDICPTTLFRMSEGLRQAGPAAQKMPILFVSVDPERDTPESLHAYLQNFAPSIIGLTGTEEQTQLMLRSYRAFAKRVNTANGWTFDHSSMVYLMSSSGRFAGSLNLDEDIKLIATTLDAHALR